MATNTNTFKTRVQLKSDTETNWNKAGPKDGSPGFVPLLGELIVYTPDATHPFSRLKVGDGSTNVISLPFIDAGTISGDTLPEDEIEMYGHYNLFPNEGATDKLYVDLNTNTIYCYVSGTGYTKLSNWTYSTSKTTVTRITDWKTGTQTSLSCVNGILVVKTGILPTLTKYDSNVVSDITKG